MKDKKPTNNSYPLQTADIVVSNLEVGPPLTPAFPAIAPLPVTVPVSFDVTNAGHEPTGDFWISATIGQTVALFQLDQVETDFDSRLARVSGIGRGKTLHLTGAIAIPQDVNGLDVLITAGCPPGSGSCAVPEIALGNNEATGGIALPPEPAPPPDPTPVIIY